MEKVPGCTGTFSYDATWERRKNAAPRARIPKKKKKRKTPEEFFRGGSKPFNLVLRYPSMNGYRLVVFVVHETETAHDAEAPEPVPEAPERVVSSLTLFLTS